MATMVWNPPSCETKEQSLLINMLPPLGSSTGEVSINLSNMGHFSIDSKTYRATMGPGLQLGQVTEQLFNSGKRSIAHGTCPSVGLGGHGTVGGAGPSARLHGLTIDHVEEMEVVLANGTIVRASSSKNSDLFFAMRGAGASFGIVTEFVFRTEPAPAELVNYVYEWTARDVKTRAQVFKSWQKFIARSNLPREFSSTMTVSPSAIIIAGAYFGPQKAFNALGFIGSFPPPQVSQATVSTNWLQVSESWGQEIQDSGIASPSYFYAKSLGFTPQTLIADATADRLFQYLATAENGTELWAVNFEVGAGAINDVAVGATAFPHRDKLWWMLSYAKTKGPVSQTTVNFLAGLNNVATSGKPTAVYGEYAGYVDPREDNERARTDYWGPNLQRLRRIKAAVDPFDIFHNQQSV